MPLVSVIVPLYNKEPFVRRCLDSIAKQTWTDFEVVVVDDGSTDSGPAVVENFDDSRFRLVRRANAGPGAARNQGLRQSTGKLLAFLDADDEWLPDYLETAVQCLDRFPGVATFTCGYFNCPPCRSSESMWIARGVTEGEHAITPDISPVLFTHMLAYMSPCSTVARAEDIRRVGGFYEDHCRFGEDAWLWLQILLQRKVYFDLTPRVRIYTDASGLNTRKLSGARPLEPFLSDPDSVRRNCPDSLQDLLARFLTLRAFKTSCAWSFYWGEWRRAAQLRNQFRIPGDWQLPFFAASAVCATPVGALAGYCARMIRKVR